MSIQRTFGEMPKEGFLRTEQLLELVPVSPVTLRRWARNGKIPAPHRIGRTVLWPTAIVREIIDAASAAHT